MDLKISPHILKLEKKSYAGGECPDGIKLDCSMGSNPYGFSRNVQVAVASLGGDDIRSYPSGTGLIDQICEYWRPVARITAGQVLLTDGGTHGLSLINTLFQRPGAAVVGISPQFIEYVGNARTFGYTYRSVQLSPENGYEISIDSVIELVDDSISLVYLDNPNNPTGQLVPLTDIRRLLDAAARHRAAVIVDEAYGGFAGDESSAVALLGDYENLIVVHTFSKAHGLAGLHAGYIVTSEAIGAQLRKVSHEFACSGIARLICSEALGDKNHLPECRQRIAATKQRLQALLHGPLSMAKSEPAVPICLLYHTDGGMDLTAAFCRAGINAISGTGFDGLGCNSVRIRIPDDARESELFRAIKMMGGDMSKK